jgi:serine-type D-Ala-D-Ala carboxypeptidase/endopeptidase
MKRSLWLIAILTIIGWTASAQPIIEESIRSRAEAAVKAGDFPSLVIGVEQDGRSEIAGFGKGSPDGRTLYEIGSVTKTFTALLLADAVERGVVKLDDPVAQLLPGFTIPKSGAHAITLVDLATQSSGLPRLPANLLPKNSNDPYADYKTADLKEFLSSYRLPYLPGDHYEYSNVGFGLLGVALSTKEAMPYADLVRQRITSPLKMNDTMIALTPEAKTRFAQGHDANGAASSPWNFAALAGCGAVRSTASDLLLYVRAHMHPEGALAKALASVTRSRRKTDRENATIGLAWQIESRGGKTIVWHNGMTGGYAAFVGFTSDGTRGVVVLSNISRDVAPLGFAALVPQQQRQVKSPNEIVLDSKELASYAGRYRLAPNFVLDVRVENGGLQVQATGQAALPVYASARDEFFYKVVDAQLSFTRDEHGQVDSVVLHQNGRNARGTREVGEVKATPARKEMVLDPATLADYAGRYELAPGFLLEVKAESGQLYVQATGQPSLPVYATARDEFFYKVVDAQLSFIRAADGKVKEVVLHQNGKDVRGAKQ